MFTGIEHFGICAKDTVAMKDWYIKLFGLSVVYENAKTPPTFFLRFPEGDMIEIYPATECGHAASSHNRVGGLRHVALTVTDFDGAVQRLLDAGVEVVDAAATSAVGISTFFFRDPEGNVLHLINRPQPL